MPGQYQQFRHAGRKRDNGSTSSSGQKKTEVVKIIFDYCCARDVFKTTAQISNKIKHLEGSYRRASDFLRTTGSGLTTNEERLGIRGIRDKVLRLCPMWERLDLFMPDRPSSNPPFLGDNLDSVSEAILQGDQDGYHGPDVEPVSAGQAFHTDECDEGDVHSTQPRSPPTAASVHSTQRRSPPAAASAPGCIAPPPASTPAAVPACTNAITRLQKKSKGFSEAILSIGEHTRKLGEQKLALRGEWQTKHFQLMQRKFDLEEQKLAVRKLELELQLEALRGKRKTRSCDSDDDVEPIY